MYIAELNVENYRSIEKVTLNILERRITCLIGGNGSGKSNVLNAIAALKNDDLLDDEYRYIGANDEQPIVISVNIFFSEQDKEELEAQHLGLSHVAGIKVVKIKPKDAAPTITIEPLDYSGSIELRLARVTKSFNAALDQKLNGEDKTALQTHLDNLLNSEQTKDERMKALDQIKIKIDALEYLEDKFADTIADIKQDLEKGVIERLTEVYNKLAIELLSFDQYKVEHEALLSELGARDQHPMLFDLLLLSGKSAADFEKAQRNNRVNVSEAASYQIQREIKKVWPKHEVKVIINKDQADAYLSFCARTPQNKAVLLKDLSEGEQWFLRFYTRLATALLQKKQVIWLFDEPDRGLHAKSQIDLRQFIEDVSKGSQIIYATHQPNMIQWHKLERIFVVENVEAKEEEPAGTVIHKRFWKDSEFKSPLREVLRLFIGDDILWGDEHVIVEGPSDYFFLTGWLNYFQKVRKADVWDKSYVTPHRTFIPVNGANNIPYFLFFLTRKSSSEVNWFALVDSGAEFKEIVSVMSKGRLKKFKSKVATIVDLVPTVAPTTKVKSSTSQPAIDIEDLFKPEDYYQEFKKHYEECYPKVKLPSLKDLSSTKKQIAKQLEEKVKKLNPELGAEYTLDKTGIAQAIYLKLALAKKDTFDKSSEDNFAELLKNIDKHFKS